VAIVQVSDVQDRLRRELEGAEEQDARDLIDLYQAELEEVLGRSVERRTFVEDAAWPIKTDRFYVKRGPIVSVTTVTIAGLGVAAADYEIYRDSIEVYTWLGTPGLLAVTYVGGFDAERAKPARQAVLARVCRMLNRHEDDDEGTKSSAVEGHSVTWMDDAFTPAEWEACSRLRAPDLVG
jgi:hypothetical protein